MRKIAPIFALGCMFLAGCGGGGEADRVADGGRTMRMEATAYSQEGATASGHQVREGMAAADPEVLPLGSRVRISGAGSYDGLYTVTDTGRTIRGREIDIYMPSQREAEAFGRRTVIVEIVARGDAPARPGE